MQTKASDNLDGFIASTERALDDARQRFQKLWEEMEGVQTEISSTQRTVDTLRAQKSVLLEELRGLKTILHPVRKLPLEILAIIFTMVVKNTISRTIRTSFSLSQVCRSWRQAAIGHSSLWTSIFINLGKTIPDLEWAMNIMGKRTGVHPVSLEVYSCPKSNNILTKTKIISSSFVVVRSLTIILAAGNDATISFGRILPDYRRHLSSLQELSLTSYLDSTDHKDYRALDNFLSDSFDGQTTCIKRLSLQRTGTIHFPGLFSLPTLTHLFISAHPGVGLLDILVRCPNLQEMTIDGGVEDTSEWEELNLPADRQISHPIRFLSVEFGSLLATAVEAVQMPHLQCLKIEYEPLPRLFGKLSQLEILDIPDTYLGNWAPIYHTAPNIKTLCVHGPGGVEMLVDWLKAGITEPPFRKLEILEIHIRFIDLQADMKLESFDRLVERRCLPEELTQQTRDPGTVQLHTIEISHYGEHTEWTRSQYLNYAKIETLDEGEIKIVWPS
ncbi:hypothetical protein FRC14_003300 [Serendipita sp. 396]|nr:hypothetical protein FRC14_003300 [Serendipita sp. 396]KAG8783153.1 hypothetical protein FRC15_005722 [Serendipita sp. 397]KAG8867468.1 hypothetical protein FRC20_005657 [Serendipita sp. 405]